MLPDNLKRISSINPVSGYTQLFHYSLLDIPISFPKEIIVGLTIIILSVLASKKIIESKGPIIIDKL